MTLVTQAAALCVYFRLGVTSASSTRRTKTASENAVASSSAFSFLRSRLTATAIRLPSPLNARHATLAGYRVLCHSRFFLSPSHTHTYPSPPPVANAPVTG